VHAVIRINAVGGGVTLNNVRTAHRQARHAHEATIESPRRSIYNEADGPRW
jgi:hypothetical protein